jgi:hypothetical protein
LDDESLGRDIVNEPEAERTYGRNYCFNIILADASQKPESQLSAIEKMHIVRNGVSK